MKIEEIMEKQRAADAQQPEGTGRRSGYPQRARVFTIFSAGAESDVDIPGKQRPAGQEDRRGGRQYGSQQSRHDQPAHSRIQGHDQGRQGQLGALQTGKLHPGVHAQQRGQQAEGRHQQGDQIRGLFRSLLIPGAQNRL